MKPRRITDIIKLFDYVKSRRQTAFINRVKERTGLMRLPFRNTIDATADPSVRPP